jgi:hypothetical protein
MNFKTTYFLFAILVLVLGTFLVTQLFGTRTTDKQAYILASLHDTADPVVAKDIDRVEIVRTRPKEENLMFYRDSHNNWRIKQLDTQADTNTIERIISQVMNARREEQADVTADLPKFGLDSPAEVVTLYRKGGDREWKLNVGNTSIGDDKAVVYVTSSDDLKNPAAVRRLDIDTLFKGVNDYRSKILLASSAFDPFQLVKLQEPKHELVSLEKTGESKWRFEKPAFGEADFDGEPPPPGATDHQKITGVRELLQAIADLRVESDDDFVPGEASDADLAAKDLDKDKAQMRIEIKKQPFAVGDEKPEPITDALLIGKKVDDKSDKVYARLESEHSIVKIPAKKLEGLRSVIDNPSVLRNRDLVQADSTHIDAIDVRLNDQETIKLRKTGDPATWKLFDDKPQEADNTPVSSLLTVLTNKRQVKDFPDPKKTDAELGLDKPATVVSLWVDGIKKEEKKDEKAEEKPKDEKKEEKAKDEKKEEKPKDDKKDAKAKDDKGKETKPAEKKEENPEPKLNDEKPTIKLAFGKKDKDIVYVRRETGGETMRLAVPISMLEKASEPKLAYLERRLPSFGTTDEIAKLTLTRGSETLGIDRVKDDKTTTWKITEPKTAAGRPADAIKVERIVNDLRHLMADKLLAEKASDQELTRFGLKTPAVKATVTVTKPDKKTEDFVYLFGNETEDKASVYAKQGNHDLVFLVRKNLLEDFQGDLQDPTVLHFDMAKLKGVKLTGWQDVVGNPLALDLERKTSQNWVAKSPADFKLDTGKIESFIASLTDLHAEKFLGKGLKPEYKLNVKEGALEIVLSLEAEKEPATLTIGATTDNSYYATNAKNPQEVFLLPKSLFEQARSKPAYFRKD